VVSTCTTCCDIRSICHLPIHSEFRINFILNSKYPPPPSHTHTHTHTHTHKQNIIQMNLCFRKLNMSQCLFYSWPLCPLLCAYLQGGFHILVQSKTFLIAAMFLTVTHNTSFRMQMICRPKFTICPQYWISYLQVKLVTAKQQLVLLLRSTKHGHKN